SRAPAGLFAPGRTAALAGSLSRADFLDVEAFQNVADLYVVEIGDSQAALETSAHFAGVVLKSLQRIQSRGVNQRAVAHHADLRVALHDAVQDVTACNGSGALDAEGVAHFGAAQIGFLDHRLEQPFHRLLNFVGNFVNDVVGADVHLFLLRKVRRFAIRAHAEGDDDRSGRAGEEHVVL